MLFSRLLPHPPQKFLMLFFCLCESISLERISTSTTRSTPVDETNSFDINFVRSFPVSHVDFDIHNGNHHACRIARATTPSLPSNPFATSPPFPNTIWMPNVDHFLHIVFVRFCWGVCFNFNSHRFSFLFFPFSCFALHFHHVVSKFKSKSKPNKIKMFGKKSMDENKTKREEEEEERSKKTQWKMERMRKTMLELCDRCYSCSLHVVVVVVVGFFAVLVTPRPYLTRTHAHFLSIFCFWRQIFYFIFSSC